MKLTIALAVILGCSAFLLSNAAQKSKPTVRPTPTPAPTKTPAKQTATPKPTATTTTPTPKPMTTPTPTPPPTPTSASGAKEPCEDKMQASGIPVCSRVQPKTVVLSKELARAKPVGFSHEAHATLKYSVDGTKVIGCAECHHTDQPAPALAGVLKTSYREAMLTAASLAVKPVFSCNACHAREGKKLNICDAAMGGAKYAFCPEIPKVKYPDEDDEVVLTNEEAYHRNCNTCHEGAVAAHKKPGTPAFIKGSPPVSCNGCHKGM